MADAGRMVDTALSRHGGLDILICKRRYPPASCPSSNWARTNGIAVLTTNVKGMFTLVKHAIGPMIARGGGKIVTLGSEMGIVAVPESPAYNASKGAVIMFTKSIAVDLIRHNIRVNALCPGITRTPLLPVLRSTTAWSPRRSSLPRRAGRRSCVSLIPARSPRAPCFSRATKVRSPSALASYSTADLRRSNCYCASIPLMSR